MHNIVNKGIYSAIGALALASCARGGVSTDTPPNIIILYTDDLGYGDISCHNENSKIQTPNIDWLATQGIRFTDGHSSCSISTPSRYAILTGTYHWRHTGQLAGNFTPTVFDADELTIAHVLRESGYSTSAIGKWHLGWDWSSVVKPGAEIVKTLWGDYYEPDMIDWEKPIKGGPMSFGFDYYYGNDCPFHPPYAMIEGERVVEAPTEIFIHGDFTTKEGDSEMRNGPMVKGWDPYELMSKLTNKVVDIIKNRATNKPIFIYYGIPAPHTPILPTAEYENSSDAGAYGDYVVELDAHIGQIIKALKESGMYDNTLLILSSDNGPEVYASERVDNFDHNSSNYLRGLKRDSYEGGHRVPFIISWPDRIKGGYVSDEVISQVDIMATVADIAGYELPNDRALDSYSLLPLLYAGERFEGTLREATVCNAAAIRKGDWLYINRSTGGHNGNLPTHQSYYDHFDKEQYSKDNPGLLFNLKQDLRQEHNLYSDYPEVVAELDSLIKKYRADGRSIPERISHTE